MVMDVSLQIVDADGAVLFTSTDRSTHMSGMIDSKENKMYHSPVPSSTSFLDINLNSQPASVKVTHYKQRGIWTNEDLWFKKQIIVSIMLGGLVSMIFLLPFIYYFSTRLTQPLMALTKATAQVSKGLSSKPVEVQAKNEIQTLAQAFNEMLSKLKTVEGLRKKLISDMAHELRTPLGNLQSFLEAMEDQIVPRSPENITKAKNACRDHAIPAEPDWVWPSPRSWSKPMKALSAYQASTGLEPSL